MWSARSHPRRARAGSRRPRSRPTRGGRRRTSRRRRCRESSSRMSGKQEPTALMCAPAASHRSEHRLGGAGHGHDDVGARARPPPPIPSRGPAACSAASASARSRARDAMRTSLELADLRQRPRSAPSPGGLRRRWRAHARSSRASARVASALAAAVRIAVIGEAFITARVWPVRPSKSVTVPWCGSSPRAALSGHDGRPSSVRRGVIARRGGRASAPSSVSSPGGRMIGRSGR